VPAARVLVLMTASFAVYYLSRRLENDAVHQALAAVSGTTYFISVAFGAFYVYAAGWLGGAPAMERIAAALLTPFVWATGGCARLYASHPPAECLYWYLNPLNVWLAAFLLFQLGAADMFARYVAARRGHGVKIAGAGQLAAVFAGLFLVIFFFAWGRGENLYVLFLEGYRYLFGSGL